MHETRVFKHNFRFKNINDKNKMDHDFHIDKKNLKWWYSHVLVLANSTQLTMIIKFDFKTKVFLKFLCHFGYKENIAHAVGVLSRYMSKLGKEVFIGGYV